MKSDAYSTVGLRGYQILDRMVRREKEHDEWNTMRKNRTVILQTKQMTVTKQVEEMNLDKQEK